MCYEGQKIHGYRASGKSLVSVVCSDNNNCQNKEIDNISCQLQIVK